MATLTTDRPSSPLSKLSLQSSDLLSQRAFVGCVGEEAALTAARAEGLLRLPTRRASVVKEMDFKPGDIVQLKSGGKPMTVSAVDGSEVKCTWSDSKGVRLKDAFPASVLTHFRPSPPATFKI